MSGYQESMTDPSFAGQLIAFTYPHIGNYGVSAEAMESERPWARAAIMREACNREDAPSAERGWLDWLTDCGVAAISGVDTRALVRHIRDAGAMRGGVFADEVSAAEARELVAAEPPMAGQDLAAVVTPREVTRHGDGEGGNTAQLRALGAPRPIRGYRSGLDSRGQVSNSYVVITRSRYGASSRPPAHGMRFSLYRSRTRHMGVELLLLPIR